MTNPREKWDILWELVTTSKAVGREAEMLSSKSTIDDYASASDDMAKALSRAMKRLEIEKLWCMPCEQFFTPGDERFDEASGYATEETVEICEDCARAMWEQQEESKVY